MEKSSKLKSAGREDTDLTLDSDKCYICLSPFEKQTVGSLESCRHVFCLECILQWSQTANTCPVDRISFASIHQRRCPGGDIQKKIKVRTKKNTDDEEEGGSAVICERCGRSDRRHRLLVCTDCDSGYHMDCLTPPLTTGPEGDWICPECAVIPLQRDSSVLEEEISDGELTDLLAEADDTPTTSSRLRPSTMNRPSSSTEQRRSQRIQGRAGVSPYPRPQICTHVPKYLLRAAKPAEQTEEVDPVSHGGISNASR
ncbi:PHD and RING finger domain-containing protein 1-like [Cheilinus undulatus]|uniref:PHD and RING finger domain-containing protein 1-like n=1 Tax=Cheilinus undulatus TaxID=241271 RepID=UPI001BD2D589|nr:PHD and RING finger domain-containing protein 1-like [Cheilinus undulatus]